MVLTQRSVPRKIRPRKIRAAEGTLGGEDKPRADDNEAPKIREDLRYRRGLRPPPTRSPDAIIKKLQGTGARPHSPHSLVGEWLSLVEHLVRDQGVGGSNPLSPTIVFKHLNYNSGFLATAL